MRPLVNMYLELWLAKRVVFDALSKGKTLKQMDAELRRRKFIARVRREVLVWIVEQKVFPAPSLSGNSYPVTMK
jgi:hypothetical protein